MRRRELKSGPATRKYTAKPEPHPFDQGDDVYRFYCAKCQLPEHHPIHDCAGSRAWHGSTQFHRG